MQIIRPEVLKPHIFTGRQIYIIIIFFEKRKNQISTPSNFNRKGDLDNYYTTDFNELNGTGGAGGYAYKGVTCQVYKQQESGTTAFYKYFNPTDGDTFYTANYNELGTGKFGYSYQGIACYVYSSGSIESGAKLLYRYYSSSALDHYYTVNLSELGNGANGYVKEGTGACLVF